MRRYLNGKGYVLLYWLGVGWQPCWLFTLLDHLNRVQPSVNFTVEVKKDSTLPFLDTFVWRKGDGNLEITDYRMPTNTNTDYIVSRLLVHHPPTSREVWSGACMTGPIVTPAPRMTCRRKNTTPTSLAELITGVLTPNQAAALEKCWAVWGMVTPSYWPGTSNRLPSHPKQSMEEPQTAILPLLTASIASPCDMVQLPKNLPPGLRDTAA